MEPHSVYWAFSSFYHSCNYFYILLYGKVYLQLIPFYYRAIRYHVDIPQCIYPPPVDGHFSGGTITNKNHYEHWYTSLDMDICFCFS